MNVKETVLANLAQIKTMNLLAGKHGVTLDSGELETVEEAAAVYYGSLNEAERQAMLVDQETIEGLYAEFALANKVYEYIIKEINPEIRDDEELRMFIKRRMAVCPVKERTLYKYYLEYWGMHSHW